MFFAAQVLGFIALSSSALTVIIAASTMAPKKTAAASAKKGVRKDDAEVEQVSRGDTSNMLTQLSNASKKDPTGDHAQLLKMYKSLSRFDSKKQEILRKWKLDKTCQWQNSYSKSISSEQTAASKVGVGFGTKCFNIAYGCFLFQHAS